MIGQNHYIHLTYLQPYQRLCSLTSKVKLPSDQSLPTLCVTACCALLFVSSCWSSAGCEAIRCVVVGFIVLGFIIPGFSEWSNATSYVEVSALAERPATESGAKPGATVDLVSSNPLQCLAVQISPTPAPFKADPPRMRFHRAGFHCESSRRASAIPLIWI